MQLFAARTSTLVAAVLFTAFLGWAHADGHGDRLAAALDAQSDRMKARYQYRHPAETLTFFGIKPGMTVVEVLPGGGWYSRILMPYLGPDGTLIGADYNVEIYRHLGFWNEEELAAKKTWAQDWPNRASKWAGDDGAPALAFVMGKMPDTFKGSADAVLLIRLLHNPQRVRSKSGTDYTSEILQDTFDVLKPGGIVGVVQHEAREDKPDEWTNGRRGYLKKSWVVARFEAAGFEFAGESDINANPKDQPGADDFVWRLPPTLIGSRNNPELQRKYRAIGESNDAQVHQTRVVRSRHSSRNTWGQTQGRSVAILSLRACPALAASDFQTRVNTSPRTATGTKTSSSMSIGSGSNDPGPHPQVRNHRS